MRTIRLNESAVGASATILGGFRRVLAWGLLLGGIASVPLPGCSDSASAEDPPEDPALAARRREVLGHLGQNVILPTYREFAGSVRKTREAATAHQATAGEPERRALQSAWAESMTIWQRAELMQLGPAGAQDTVVGGADLRDEIYSYPLSNTCRVDQETAEQAFGDPEALQSEAVNVRGLDALEAVSFRVDDGNDCSLDLSLNSDGIWAALGGGVVQLRADHGVALGLDLEARVNTLVTAWEPDGGDFLTELSQAGAGSTIYPTTRDGLNAVFAAMFYVDTQVKDVKLNPLLTCSGASCPETVESPWARTSRANVVHNLEGLQLLFLGNRPGQPAAPGFDDLITEAGRSDLATDFAVDLEAAIVAVEAVPESDLSAAAAVDPGSVQAAYDAIKRLTDSLKTEFSEVLELDLPDRAQGDND